MAEMIAENETKSMIEVIKPVRWSNEKKYD